MAKEKINLNQMLYQIDSGNKKWYNELDEEIKKSFSPYLAMRFASSTDGQQQLKEHYLLAVNEFCNKNFSLIQKHGGDSELFWKLLAVCGVKKKMFNPWIKAPKGKGKKSKVDELLSEAYPNAKLDEKELLKEIMTKDDIRNLAMDLGWEDKEIKLLLK